MKFIFCISILFSSAISYGQLYKNNWVLGGTGSFSQRDGKFSSQSISYDSKYTELKISPNVGYFLLDKLSIGVKGSIDWGKNKAYPPGGGTTNITRYFAGPSVRYYFLDLEKQFNILTEANLQFGKYISKPFTGSINNYSIMAGPIIFFNSSVGLEFLVGYNSQKESVKNLYDFNQKGLSLQIGFQYFLESKN